MLSVAPIVALALGMAVGMKSVSADAALESPKRHVRCLNDTLRSFVRTGFERSPTFASLLARLENSDVIVHIETLPRLPGALEGRLLMMPRAHDHRYVRIQVALRGTKYDTIALLGHELQHAVEVADAPTVSDERDLSALYKHIGLDYGNDVYETVAAQEVGKRVLKELA